MTNVLLVDDHDLFRDGLKGMLHKIDEITVVGEATNGLEAIEKYKELKPDMIIMDISMPLKNGIKATEEIRVEDTEIKILALSMNDDQRNITKMLGAGANGYILKTCREDELLEAVEKVASGEYYFSKDVKHKMIDNFIAINVKPLNQKVKLSAELSEREIEVLNHIADGLTNEEIAEKLFLSKRTVESHRRNMLEKTGAKNSAALVKHAILEGLISV